MVTEKTFGVEELRDFAVDVIRRAGAESLVFYGKGKTSIKFDDDLVTEAELHLADFFRDRLADRFPEHQIFSNQHEIEKSYTHEGKRYLWVFDALDGVANFQAGIPIWSLSVALMENYWPIFGAVYMPATDDLFYAQAGQKAFWGDQQISVSGQDTLNDESLFLTYSRFHHYYHSSFPGKIRNLGCTAAHICYVAMGRAEAAVVANESYQDLAAARMIVEASGGKIFNMDGSAFFPSDYLNGQRIDGHLLITSPELFQSVRSCLQTAT